MFSIYFQKRSRMKPRLIILITIYFIVLHSYFNETNGFPHKSNQKDSDNETDTQYDAVGYSTGYRYRILDPNVNQILYIYSYLNLSD